MRHQKGFSRRQFIGAATAAGTAAALGTGPDVHRCGRSAATTCGRRQPCAARIHAVLTNGRIHTMDARNTIARSVSIRNGRFVAVGDTPPARAANTRVVDLKGRTVVPGLIEGHVHIVSLANRPGYHTPLENTASIREIDIRITQHRQGDVLSAHPTVAATPSLGRGIQIDPTHPESGSRLTHGAQLTSRTWRAPIGG